MLIPRRQHNATVLPNGSVLVIGGNRGDRGGTKGNADDVRFNDLHPGRPMHVAELRDPKSEKWTTMAPEQIGRCYHSTAVLLPDARDLSAGGGKFQLGTTANDLKDSHRDTQILSPLIYSRTGRDRRSNSSRRRPLNPSPHLMLEIPKQARLPRSV